MWGVGALYFAAPASPSVRAGLAGCFALFGMAALAALFVRRGRRPALAVFLAAVIALLGWWSTIEPSNERDWTPDVARLPRAELDGELVTVRNIRNFDYRSETDFTPRYYDKTFDLRRLESVDLFAVYWMGPHIAHTILSFGFAGGDHLAVSIETRKEKHESYSALGGFFRQYELIYVVADERDVIRLRTNYRKDPPGGRLPLPSARPGGERPAPAARVPSRDQRAQWQARVLQHAHRELHRQHLAAQPSQSRAPAVLVEDSGERPRAGVSAPGGKARSARLVR